MISIEKLKAKLKAGNRWYRVEGFRSGRLDPKVFLPRIYGLAYGTGFLHGRKESDRLRKEYEKN
jgi:hypothetical protein